MISKNISVLILLSCVLLSCGKKKGSDAAGPVNCDQYYSGEWSGGDAYTTYTVISKQCAISMPACALSGTIDFKNSSYVKVNITSSNPTASCPLVGSHDCSYNLASSYTGKCGNGICGYDETFTISCSNGGLVYTRRTYK